MVYPNKICDGCFAQFRDVLPLLLLSQVATAMINLGRVLEEKGQYTDALIYLRKGLTIREKVLEEGHPDTISALAWIGVSDDRDACLLCTHVVGCVFCRLSTHHATGGVPPPPPPM